MVTYRVQPDFKVLLKYFFFHLCSYNSTRYSDDPCLASLCFCWFIYGKIHASSLGTKKPARRKSLVYG